MRKGTLEELVPIYHRVVTSGSKSCYLFFLLAEV